MSGATREISPFLMKVRAALLGRVHDNNLRFPAAVATRSIPEPNLPEGPSHKLSANYYFTRDARREVQPPKVLAESNKALGTGEEGGAVAARTKSKTPGKIMRYSEFSSASPL